MIQLTSAVRWLAQLGIVLEPLTLVEGKSPESRSSAGCPRMAPSVANVLKKHGRSRSFSGGPSSFVRRVAKPSTDGLRLNKQTNKQTNIKKRNGTATGDRRNVPSGRRWGKRGGGGRKSFSRSTGNSMAAIASTLDESKAADERNHPPPRQKKTRVVDDSTPQEGTEFRH